MTAVHEMQNPGDPPVDISDHVLLPDTDTEGFRVSSQAEEGSVGSSEVTFDDPDGTFYPIGLNAYRIREDTSEADDPLLFAGAFGARTESRGPYRTGASRIVNAQIQDANAALSRYVIRTDEDGDRPEETDEERIEWLFTTSGMALHWDIATSIIEPTGVTLSAMDLTDYTPQQILDDMAQQSGNNYYVYIDGSVDPPEALLVYAPDSGTHLTSDLRFSNVIADVDDATTFYLGLDVEQEINPERVTSYVSVRYAKGRVDENDDDTADVFSRIDKVMDAPLIKTAGVATTRALQYLEDLGTEETTVSGTVFLPAAKASQFRAGMRCEMKATHLTGMSNFVWVRLLSVTVTQISEDPNLTYALAFEGTFNPSFFSCATVVGDLDPSISANISGGPSGVGASLPAATGDYLAIAYLAIGNNGTFLAGNVPVNATAGGWTSGECRPESPGATHTLTNWARATNQTTNPAWSWAGTGSNAAAEGRQVGFTIPGATFVQEATAVNGLGVPTWASPLTAGNMLLCLRTAEGPTSWTGDPTGADWTLIADVADALEASGSSVQVWVACYESGDIETGEAGSSWWAHVLEVSF